MNIGHVGDGMRQGLGTGTQDPYCFKYYYFFFYLKYLKKKKFPMEIQVLL